uniref:Uncharacterized protein n=1 Tax=Syphacia muris TaxID=451379 RepID=A0A0N5ALM5_9BILA
MGNIAGVSHCDQPLSNRELVEKIKRMLPKRNKSADFDRRTKEYRVALMVTMMKQRRIKRLRHNFRRRLQNISQEVEKSFDRIRAEVLSPFNGLPLDNYFPGAEVARAVYDEIVQKDGINDRSLKKFLTTIEDSPFLSFNFFDSASPGSAPKP